MKNIELTPDDHNTFQTAANMYYILADVQGRFVDEIERIGKKYGFYNTGLKQNTNKAKRLSESIVREADRALKTQHEDFGTDADEIFDELVNMLKK